ncbi:hypothetical protein Fcan01_11691 [Folsomia candida]|uniref:F-box domain-containing protein n=1 Tax=Folsomia candida TaxID=158441 RepID=A0A226EEF3_FOLCA|nr:hypothetical protein Fcan01_11691 [Folsomia candida]
MAVESNTSTNPTLTEILVRFVDIYDPTAMAAMIVTIQLQIYNQAVMKFITISVESYTSKSGDNHHPISLSVAIFLEIFSRFVDVYDSTAMIIHCIMEFIPISRLIKLTQINSTWEKEARNHLKARSPLRLYPRNKARSIAKYLSKPDYQGYPKNVRFTLSDNCNLNDFISDFSSFSAKYCKTVKRLSVNWFISDDISESHQLWEICASYTNLASFETRICISRVPPDGREALERIFVISMRQDLIPAGILFPKVDRVAVGIVPLLYESFLRERIPRCESLRELEIPLPQRDKFRLYKSRESVGGEEYRWRNSEEYLKRIQNTFPGVDYQVLNPVWKRVQNLW